MDVPPYNMRLGSGAHWLPLNPPNLATPLRTHQQLASNTWKKKFQAFPPDSHSCSHMCPQTRAVFLPANYEKMFTPIIKDWKEITYTDGNVIKHKDDSPPLAGSDVYKPVRETSQLSQHLQLHTKPTGHGPTNATIEQNLQVSLWHSNKGKLTLPPDSAYRLSQVPKQTLNVKRIRPLAHGIMSSTTPTSSIHYLTNLTDKLKRVTMGFDLQP
eukprot:1144728-Pelagomonas_calceolata.AAC.1